ncbi:hypothetical protein FGG78_14885 [Thioclava sp. BHET1]|uniref:Uncharacterized protein n=1 Tax=Thioclava dalianensis TaxID=1185766 RepID=A0A074TP90_9RHOB|nr:hypothetical protein [Thioclava dalianensis]KEP70778.1 hypothetical protein DL1_13170 [Thioclava dalianensis]TMV89495.1 hypothetical protein FGG78_14885 [Thioclava sp. BHET1]SFN10520.1 hypothetical protein SAMN05216224_102431 [Thioclava dalianensis]
MAERIQSQDGRSETREILGDTPATPTSQGSAGGELQRKVGTRDEKKRVDETSAGKTRPLGQDQDGSGDKEKM